MRDFFLFLFFRCCDRDNQIFKMHFPCLSLWQKTIVLLCILRLEGSHLAYTGFELSRFQSLVSAHTPSHTQTAACLPWLQMDKDYQPKWSKTKRTEHRKRKQTQDNYKTQVCADVRVRSRKSRVQRPLLLSWFQALLSAIRPFPAGRNLWRLQCNKPEKCCGWIETERSPFLQGQRTHSLRNSHVSTNLCSDVLALKWKREKERGHFRASGRLFGCISSTDIFQESGVKPSLSSFELIWILNAVQVSSPHPGQNGEPVLFFCNLGYLSFVVK